MVCTILNCYKRLHAALIGSLICAPGSAACAGASKEEPLARGTILRPLGRLRPLGKARQRVKNVKQSLLERRKTTAEKTTAIYLL